jgi:putative transposase
MKAGQFSDEQIVAILQEAAKGEKPIVEFCRQKGISEATFYAWRKKFGGMQVQDAQRLKNLEKENARLKRLLAEKVVEIDCLKEVASKNW